jgi:hypothetical protein
VAVWDFSAGDPGSVRLWPADRGAPERQKRQLRTAREGDRLAAVVEGGDPYFVWRFGEPFAAASFGARLHAETAGKFQLFWSSFECPTFSEACSQVTDVPAGDAVVEFLLDPTKPVRELRFDLPEQRGARLWFDSIEVRRTGRIDSAWIGRADHSTVEVTPDGIRLDARGEDPWMTVSTPGLFAARVNAIEVVLRAPPSSGAPQLFWDGPCGHFSEECSVVLRAADSGALTHRADLGENPRWTGRIGALRFDPGALAGEYFLERIALVHDR